ncbi:uncharacterized protein LOC132169771 [Corylus avellana]|uniref:uncharacterized protein LOC132169771 n=1 Tax=Corylus avellana TaxID=13451 RepID=UPI00286CB21A|nr:uncharacterized protein LOC132169771 [Corylus avellana]
MTEELTTLWGKLTLMEEEDVRLGISENGIAPLVDRGNACVVGKLLADRTVGKEIVKTPLLRAWQPTGRVSFKTLGPNLFLIDFEHEWDKSRIMEGRPWTFDGHLVSLLDFDGITPPSQLHFEKAAFWIRMYNLPLACMGKAIGQQIGASVGEVEEVDVDEDGVGWGEYLRVRVTLDLAKPLSRGRTITLRNNTLWVPFQYEKIPKYCFRCGVIRHGTRGCVRVGGQRAYGRETEPEFGPWLRVPSPNRRRGTGGGWNHGGKWGRNQPENFFEGDRQHQQWRHMGDVGGGVGAEHGGGSAGTATTPVKGGSNNVSRNSSLSPSKRGSGNKGALKEKERVVMGGADLAQTVMGRLYGDISSNNGEGEGRGESKGGKVSEEINCNKGKNIYVGQWDTIKEKMVWDSLDKVNGVQFIREISSGDKLAGKANRVVTSVQHEEGNGLFTFGSKSTYPSGHADESPMVNTRYGKKRGKKTDLGRAGDGENSRKRKIHGENTEVDSLQGKRNRYADSPGEGDNEVAVAAEQPRHQI